ncbi:hypothetical protein GCM10020000_02320 [Streptomyces olivoverticillatus]
MATSTFDASAAAPETEVAPLRDRAVPLVAQLTVWSGAAAVLGLWWTNTNAVVGAGGWLAGAGRITGLLAGYACAVLLALMARVPLLDRGVGTDRLARWHAAAAAGTRCASPSPTPCW